MTKTLAIAPDLKLSIEAATEKSAYLGRTGGGKTYAAQKMAELMHAAGVQIVALDPVGKWWSLRLAADGVSPGIVIPVFGGLHGDIPLEPHAGKMIADVIVDRGISAVIDVSQFESAADMARFATAFGERLFYRKKAAAPSALHLFLEEAQEIMPQNPQRDEAKMLHVWTRNQKLGRNFGMGSSIITQRPQEVNKKCLNMTELLFVFQMTGPQERKAVENWIKEKGIDEDITAELPKLARGSAHVWSPSVFNISRVVAIGTKWTYDASATVKVGARGAEVRPLAPVDVEKLGKEIAASAERAKAEDPKELRKQITQLRADLAKATKGNGNGHARGVPVVDEGAAQKLVDRALAAAAKERAQMDARRVKIVRQIGASLARVGTQLSTVATSVSQASKDLEDFASLYADSPVVAGAPAAVAVVERAPAPRPTALRERKERAPVEGEASLGKTPQRILNALRFYRALGIDTPSRAQVSGLLGISWDTGTFRSYLSEVRTAGFIEDRGDGRISLTESGAARAVDEFDAHTLAEIHELWYRKMGRTPAAMLRIIVREYPNAVTRAAIAHELGIEWDTGTFRSYLSELRTPGLIEDVSRTEVRASGTLFPEGLS